MAIYVKFFVAGTTTPKVAFADKDKTVSLTKQALDGNGRAMIYGDGIYRLAFYSSDPDVDGVFLYEVDNYKCTSVSGNARTITAASVAGTADDALVLANTSSNNITYTMPSAVGYGTAPLTLKKVSAVNVLTYAAAAGENIDGSASGTLTDLNATVQFFSDGTNWRGAQIVGEASTLSGYAADTGETGLTIPVRRVDGTIPGSCEQVGVLNVKVIDIGDWEMGATASVSISHGLTGNKIRDYSAKIIQNGVAYASHSLESGGTIALSGGSGENISLTRTAGGIFDSIFFNGTSFNRGYITIWYVD